jgi:hypothetical protein
MKLLIVIAVFASFNCVAGIGTITELQSSPASIQRQKTTIDGKKGTGIEMQDAVRTTQGKTSITFEDNTRVQINENSRLVIDDFVYDASNAKGGKLAMKVALGTVRYASGAIAKNNAQSVAINTPTATIGVRGTDFTATVDEIGRSTIILLPSCPKVWKVLERDCVTGSISITNETGTIILNQPFQAARVETIRSKLNSVILKLSEADIGNLLILSPPREFKEKREERGIDAKGALDIDFLKENGLVNMLDKQSEERWQNKLTSNFLEQDFLANILDIVNAQMAAQLDLLNNQKSGLLPDYISVTGVKVAVDDSSVELCRDDGSNIQCVQTPKNQNSTITQIQGSIEIKNRINSGGNTIIIVKQSN